MCLSSAASPLLRAGGSDACASRPRAFPESPAGPASSALSGVPRAQPAVPEVLRAISRSPWPELTPSPSRHTQPAPSRLAGAPPLPRPARDSSPRRGHPAPCAASAPPPDGRFVSWAGDSDSGAPVCCDLTSTDASQYRPANPAGALPVRPPCGQSQRADCLCDSPGPPSSRVGVRLPSVTLRPTTQGTWQHPGRGSLGSKSRNDVV